MLGPFHRQKVPQLIMMTMYELCRVTNALDAEKGRGGRQQRSAAYLKYGGTLGRSSMLSSGNRSLYSVSMPLLQAFSSSCESAPQMPTLNWATDKPMD